MYLIVVYVLDVRHAAASYGHQELVELLVSKGADLHIRDLDGDTPLLVCEEASVFETLISLGADVNARNNDGQGIIEKVLEDENIDFLNYLLMAGHIPEASDLFQKVQFALKEVEQPEEYDGEFHPEGIEEGDEDEEDDDEEEMTA